MLYKNHVPRAQAPEACSRSLETKFCTSLWANSSARMDDFEEQMAILLMENIMPVVEQLRVENAETHTEKLLPRFVSRCL